jgi:hypothetical protein
MKILIMNFFYIPVASSLLDAYISFRPLLQNNLNLCFQESHPSGAFYNMPVKFVKTLTFI